MGVLHGLTPETLGAQPGTPVLLKKRNLLDINELDSYFRELKKRASRKPRKG